MTRSILVLKIYELWGTGVDYESLHADIRARTEDIWPDYPSQEDFMFNEDEY